jgi:hypothetical protein
MARYKGCGATEVICADCGKTSQFDHHLWGRKGVFCSECAEAGLTRGHGAPRLAEGLAKDEGFLRYCCGFIANSKVEETYLS